MTNPKKVGEGTYGCVHNPPLKCKNKLYDSDPTKVSKILTTKNANNELKEFKLIQQADTNEDFHLGKPGSCFPDTNVINQIAIDECRDFGRFEIDNYKLLLLKNGGADLAQIKKKFSKLKINNNNRRNLELFWLDMSRILYGSKVLMDNGIVHHDLKQQNIVYNEANGRANFIDFGLMTTTKEMLKKANSSRYPYGEHWSFPPDILFYNYVTYKQMTAVKGNKRHEKIQAEYKKYHSGPFEIIRNELIDKDENVTDFSKRTTIAFYDYYKSLHNDDDSYNKFINKSFETFDNYAIGFSLFSLLKTVKDLTDENLFNDLKLLFLSMISFNVFKRPSPSEVVDKYEFILKSNGLLDKYNMRFENHFLVDGSEKQEQEKKIKELPKSVKKFIDDLILKCPAGKEHNPKTQRCVNICKDGYSRDGDFKCKKNKTQKKKKEIIDLVSTESDPVKIIYHKSPDNKTLPKKKCTEEKELNPKTNRCVNKCKDGYSRDIEFNCKKDKK